jgi:transposase
MRFDLSDEEWALLEPRLPKSRKSARVDDRKIVNAIFYVLRTGMPWRDLLLNSSTVGSTINAR